MFCQRDWVVFSISALLTGCVIQQNLESSQAHRHNFKTAVNYSIKSLIHGEDVEPSVDIAFDTLMRVFVRQVRHQWGDLRPVDPDEYIKYSNQYRTRAMIDFAKGEVHVETLDREDLRRAIIFTLLMPEAVGGAHLFSAGVFGDREPTLGQQPMLYRQVLDHHNQPIRWQWRAEHYADYLIKNYLFERTISEGIVYGVSFNLVKNHIQRRSYYYSGIVRTIAKKYKVDESLIYAVMRTESHFNPAAVSEAKAYGLMQVVPSSGGRDVFRLVKQIKGEPSPEYLFHAANNIDIGTAYLHLLDTVYLKDIKDPLSRHYAVISAYNGGARNVYRAFDRNSTIKAIKMINAMAPDKVYQYLTTRHPLLESRNYLKKVAAAQKDFRSGEL